MLRFDQQLWVPTLSSADYVHDVAYNYYGTKVALCTSGQKIFIFEAPTESEGDPGSAWVETGTLERAHAGGPIWRLSWAHPEHGEILASCSEDGTVKIWSEVGRTSSAATPTTGARSCPAGRWRRRAELSSASGAAVLDVRFAPAPLGLKLASCSDNRKVRIFECADPLDLAEWLPEDLDCPARSAAPRSGAAAGHTALDWKPIPLGGGAEDGETIAIVDSEGRLAFWARQKNNRWNEVASVEAHPGQGGAKDVAWCPNLCRPYELVATCGAGAALWRFELPSGFDHGRKDAIEPTSPLSLLCHLVDPADERVGVIWRCSWSLAGTTLALCPEEGEVSIWKTDAALEWRCVSEIEAAEAAD